MMQVKVVNLDRNPERFAVLKARLDALGVAFARVSAVDGLALSPAERRASVKRFRWWCAVGRTPSPAEIGCAKSHYGIYAQLTEPVCILEDDVEVADEFKEVLDQVSAFLDPTRAQVVLLSDRYKRRREKDVVGTEIVRSANGVFADGYVITPPAARALLNQNERLSVPCDWWGRWVRRGAIELYHAPTVVRQNRERFGSATSELRNSQPRSSLLGLIIHKSLRLVGRTLDAVMEVLLPAGKSATGTVRRVVFCWSGFPQYAARLVGAFVKAHPELEVRVFATRPGVPVERMERLCGCPVEWVVKDAEIQADVDERTLVLITGWHVRAFLRFGAKARRAGGRAVLMCDNNWEIDAGLKHGICRWIKGWRFRLCQRRRFDGFMVPGESGRKLLRSWGMHEALIQAGMYAADAALFRDGGPLSTRPKRILYVGQFSARKNVRRLVEAFEKVKGRGEGEQGWELHLYGSGPLKEELSQAIEQSNDRTIHLHDFLQPEELAAKYREARVFCLPSVEEHWGLVVHEAALSGCALALSNRVGAAADLLEPANGVSFDPYSVEAIAEGLRAVMSMDAAALEQARVTSIAKAREIGLAKFVHGVEAWV